VVHEIALMARLPCPPSQGEGVAIEAQGYAGNKGPYNKSCSSRLWGAAGPSVLVSLGWAVAALHAGLSFHQCRGCSI